SKGLPLGKRLGLGVFQFPRLFDAGARVAAVAQRPLLRRGSFLRLPLPARWAWRSVPALARRPARDVLFGRTFEPNSAGPWAQSGARGKTVAYFIQCVTDRFAPEQAFAAVRLLQACGARVVVPSNQHCCGLPQLDSGDKRGARRLAKRTIAALEAQHVDHVVTAAASCAVAIMHDYAHLLEEEPTWAARARRLADSTMDLLSFVDRVASPPPLDRKSDAESVT